MMLDKLVLALVIIGALNWGSIGIFQFDLVAALFGGQAALLSRIVYTLVALAGVWAISFFFRDTEVSHETARERHIEKIPATDCSAAGIFCTCGKEIYFSLRLHNRFFNLYILAARRRSVFSMSTSMRPSS